MPRFEHGTFKILHPLDHNVGNAKSQAISRQLHTLPARVRAQGRSCGICGGQSGTGAGFFRVLRFPPTAPHSSSIFRGWYNRPVSGENFRSMEHYMHYFMRLYGTLWNIYSVFTVCRDVCLNNTA
jgi:hypothetical protein